MDRPVLAPGLRVLRRSRTVLQVGLTPQRRVLLPDSEPVRRTLAQLSRGEAPPADADTREVLDLLAPLLVDGSGLVVPGVAPGDVAAAALLDPWGYPDRLAARGRTLVAVRGELPAVDPRPLLRAAGLGVVDDSDARRSPALVLALEVGEVDRADLDPWVRARVPHLVVRLVEGEAVVGPLVDPGRTACLRCLDAHAAEIDPQAAVLAAVHARSRDSRRDGVTEPVDTALATLAVAWAVRDLVSHVDGDRPSTWSTTVHLSATLSTVTQTEWRRHPACGCAWLPDEAVSRTMSG
jgi:bacteriocin biosynthesis cyclodehydratase domain-containing protein